VPAGIESAMIRNIRGIAYALNADHQRALAEFEAVVQIAPNLANAYAVMGVLQLASGPPAFALKSFETSIRQATTLHLRDKRSLQRNSHSSPRKVEPTQDTP
jgi:Tfp pilus assembly protein PilF